MPKLIALILLLLIVGSLGSALFHMLRGKDPQHMARSLTWRVGLSASLFILLIVFYKIGWIVPHGLTPTAP